MGVHSRLKALSLSAATAVGLLVITRRWLPGPPLSGASALREWFQTRSTLNASLGTLCLVGVAAACYLALLSAAAILAELARFTWLSRLVEWLTPRSLRPMLGIAMGATVATAVVGATLPREAGRPTATMVATIEHDATATMYVVARPSPPPSVPIASTAPPASVSAPTIPAPAPPSTPAVVTVTPAAPAAAVASAATPVESWTIRPGEHLWLVAAETVQDHLGRNPSEREIAPYWKRLIAANRNRLVDPDNPDVVYAGQVFVLPPFGP